MPEDRPFSDAELDAAVQALAEPERLGEAQHLVMRIAPQLQRVLNAALEEGGWLAANEQGARGAAGEEDPEARLRAVRTLLAEETRLGMLVGVAVGYELARQLSTPED